MRNKFAIQLVAWAITAGVIILAILAWLETLLSQSGKITTYQIFPIFGLLAFSTMWSQYVAGTFKDVFKVSGNPLQSYYVITGYMVLVEILLHPGLLVGQLWHDGFGLPPSSYLNHFVLPGLQGAAIVGTVCFLVFLTFELHRWLGNKKWWYLMGYACDLAMLGIFYHASSLGHQTRFGWFHNIWLFYGLSLILILIYKYINFYKKKSNI